VFNRSMSDPLGQYRCKLAETGGGAAPARRLHPRRAAVPVLRSRSSIIPHMDLISLGTTKLWSMPSPLAVQLQVWLRCNLVDSEVVNAVPVMSC